MSDPVNQWNNQWDKEQERIMLRGIEVQRVAQVIAKAISPTEMEEALVGPFLSPLDFQQLTKAYHKDDMIIIHHFIVKAVKAWALDQAEASVGEDRILDNYGGTDVS